MSQPNDEPKQPTTAQLWSRLTRLKRRKEEFNSKIDAEITDLKKVLEAEVAAQ